MAEINLLINYPQSKRNVSARAAKKTAKDRAIGRRFGKEYFDGDRRYGYGGYSYNPRFWRRVVPTFQKHYHLTAKSTVLDVGCAKGFFMHDIAAGIPGITVRGLDISWYAINHALEDMKPHIVWGDAKKLPFADHSFDLVISINTIHNLASLDCKKALKEIMRVTRSSAFIIVDAYRSPQEKNRMEKWNLTAKTFMHVDRWKAFFASCGYRGDYFWFIP